MFVIILLILLIIIFILPINSFKLNLNQENFFNHKCKLKKFPYNPPILTPKTNYDQIISKINSQNTYKKDLSVSLSPTPTIHCIELDNKLDCNKFGCNWFGSSNIKNTNSFCSSTYPTQI